MIGPMQDLVIHRPGSSWLGRAWAWLRGARPRGPRVAEAGPRGMPAAAITDPLVLKAQAALRNILDRHPKARAVFPHLALLEQGLQRLGALMLHDLSVGALLRLQQQLQEVAGPEASPVLDLLKPAIDSQLPPQLFDEVTQEPEEDEPSPSRFGTSLDVEEADATMYFAAMRAWQDTLVEDDEEGDQETGQNDEESPWLPTRPMETVPCPLS